MSRLRPHRLPTLFSVFLTVLLTAVLTSALTPAHAQSRTNVPVRAVVSYANLLTPELAAELQPTFAGADDFAFGIVNRYMADSTVGEEIGSPINLALTNGALPHEAFVMYLADVVNGPAPAPTSMSEALALLGQAGVRVPTADANGLITEESLATALRPGNEDSVVANSGNTYNDPITPTAGR